MSETDPLSHLAAWLAPASAAGMTPETVARRRQAVLLTSDCDLEQLVMVAHGAQVDSVQAEINEHLSSTDDSYVPSKNAELVTRVAGAAIVNVMSKSDQRALDAALMVGSANFLGMSSKVEAVPALAAEVEQAARGRARQRLLLKDSGPTVKQLLDTADGVDTETLRRGLQALSRRFDQVVGDLEQRLQLMDEETNTLWWSQDPRSERTGKLWTEMKPLARVATAAYEAGRLNRRRPATQGLIRVAETVAGSPDDETVQLGKMADAFVGLIEKTDVRRRLVPIHSCVGLAIEYSSERAALGAVAKTSLGLSLSLQVPLAKVPEQYLRELALLTGP